MSRQTPTLDVACWKRKYPILFQLCQGQSSVITAVNSLLTSKGCFIRLKKKPENRIVFTDVSTHKIISILFKNLSLGFVRKIFLKFRKFQPLYSCKIYNKKECMCQAAHQASTDKNNLIKKQPIYHLFLVCSQCLITKL